MKITILFLSIGVAAGCGKKTAPAGAGDSGAAATGPTAPAAPTTPTTPTTPTGTPPATAEGGAVEALKDVSDCPKSLSGGEQVARVIKKECGPVRVTADYTVEGSLTLEAGAVLKFDEGVELAVGYNRPGKIVAKGTAADPVVFTSAGDPVAGFWKGLHIYNHGNRSRLDGLVIENAGNENGALLVAATDVGVKGTTIRNAKEVGLKVANEGTLAELAGNTFEKAGAMAASLPASQVGAVGEGNKFDAGAVIEVRGDAVAKSAKWIAAGAPYVFTGETNIDGSPGRAVVEIQPGTELRFAEGARLNAGYMSPGGISAVGTAEKPILFTAGGEKKVGAWPGVAIYSHGEGRFENAVFESAGQDEDKGAIWADGESTITVKGTTFKGNRAALVIGEPVKLKAYEGNKHSGDEKRSLLVSANHVASLGAGNTFEGENEKIEVRGGTVSEGGTWLAQPVPFEITAEVTVDTAAPLVLSPGIDLRFRDGVVFNVGYAKESKLTASGTADKPIKMRGVREEPGSWTGVIFNHYTRSSTLENVEMSYAGGDAGVVARGEAVVKVANLTCVKCTGPALTYECGSKVTASDIKAGEGTPAGEKKPEGCQ